MSCDDQAELDRYWNALLETGARRRRAGGLVKLDIATFERAYKGT